VCSAIPFAEYPKRETAAVKLFKRSGGRDVDHDGNNNADADVDATDNDDREVDNGTAKSVSGSDNGIKGDAGDRRHRSRALNQARLFDDDAATTLRTQLINLAADLERSRSAEVVASQRAKHLAASFAEVRLTLETFVPDNAPQINADTPEAPTALVADPSPPQAQSADGERRARPRTTEEPRLFDDDATTALRVQLAALAAELEDSRTAEVLASQQAEMLAVSLASIKATIDGLGSRSAGRAEPSSARTGNKRSKPPGRRRKRKH
jgi:hypothetical protein